MVLGKFSPGQFPSIKSPGSYPPVNYHLAKSPQVNCPPVNSHLVKFHNPNPNLNPDPGGNSLGAIYRGGI